MIDIGVNINHKEYINNLDCMLLECEEAGVEGIVCIASNLNESQSLKTICENHHRMWFTLGCHPHQAKTWNKTSSATLTDFIEEKRPIAIGETGLDFNRNFSTRSEQIYAFEEQIEIAQEYHLPLYLHERNAHSELLNILKQHHPNCVRGIIHCFTGTKEELAAYLDLGLYIGVTGWVCDERRGQSLQKAIPHIPTDKLLLETDSPYLLPRNIQPRPRRNHPKYLPWVAKEIARLKNMELKNLIQQTKKNTQKLFF